MVFGNECKFPEHAHLDDADEAFSTPEELTGLSPLLMSSVCDIPYGIGEKQDVEDVA